MRKQHLYLFSSDQSQQYARDILNVLAAPVGLPYTFRYDSRHVEDRLLKEWEALQDTPVCVVFSLQQQAQFQPAAFIPIRRGYVLRSYSEGDRYFIEFRVGGYIGLPDALAGEGAAQKFEAVNAFTKGLSEIATVPYQASASLGSPVTSSLADTASGDSDLFCRTGEYLGQCAVFEQTRFFRVLGIRPHDDSDSAYLKTYAADPAYRLKSGRSYDLQLFHCQPHTPAEPEAFSVSVDETMVRIIGEDRFEVASRYDLPVIRLATGRVANLDDHETTLSISPAGEVLGPSVELGIRVEAERQRAIGTATLQALALIAVALAGALSELELGFRITLAVAGAIAAVLLGLLGARTLTVPTLPRSTTST